VVRRVLCRQPDTASPPPPSLAGIFTHHFRCLIPRLMVCVHRGEFGAVEHWAKVEAMHDDVRTAKLRERLAARFPVADFNAARRSLDPKNILANNIVDALFPL
jgi:hypothetical protein